MYYDTDLYIDDYPMMSHTIMLAHFKQANYTPEEQAHPDEVAGTSFYEKYGRHSDYNTADVMGYLGY